MTRCPLREASARRVSRRELRLASAAYLNSLSSDYLFEHFGITRVGDCTGLDRIGVPVLTTCRPAAKIVSVNAGKSLERGLARAGAIAEAIEFSIFERTHVKRTGKIIDLGFPLAADSVWNPRVPVALDEATHLESGLRIDFPASLLWLVRPENEEAYFQKSSNGQATGATLEDALCQGIYECVERDQYVLRRCILSEFGAWPPRCAFDSPLVDAIKNAGLNLYLFSCDCDLSIPVYWAIIIDPAWRHCGGWGAHLDPYVAAERAVLEAIQSRGVAIAGARDDLERRDPDWQQGVVALKELEALPVSHWVGHCPIDLSPEQELELILSRLGIWRERIYFSHIDPLREASLEQIHAVKVQILGFEQPVMRHWKALRWPAFREQYLLVQASIESVVRSFPENFF